MLGRNDVSIARIKRNSTSVASVVTTFSLCIGFWLVLADDEIVSWVFGVVAASTSTFIHYRLKLPGVGYSFGLPRLSALARLLFFFLRHSLQGGIDTAKLAYQRQPCAEECVFQYQTKLKSEKANFLFVQMISLMPGTLGIKLIKNNVLIHSLSREATSIGVLQDSEAVISALFERRTSQ
ncbi:Na+/H+ antiporter subunit E [Salinimonas sp. HHU 13199]|uniref:Na+/H+ antiporter subunit E n=1 Tax=Salinimonas profundi TaxID=2729140 RepID=A0ABR8LF98_9ALTE|nr:Na+/H+ antiporter subunit E [Salinimonas profundi]MBD3584935.1 Na+/H+ antiporter subunit E [Salinimonas profundi]